jgi:hypothetical protein
MANVLPSQKKSQISQTDTRKTHWTKLFAIIVLVTKTTKFVEKQFTGDWIMGHEPCGELSKYGLKFNIMKYVCGCSRRRPIWIFVWVDLSFPKSLAINVFCEGFHEKIANICSCWSRDGHLNILNCSAVKDFMMNSLLACSSWSRDAGGLDAGAGRFAILQGSN